MNLLEQIVSNDVKEKRQICYHKNGKLEGYGETAIPFSF